MTKVEIALAGEPTAKGRPRATRRGVLYTPKETRDYEIQLRLAAGEAMDGRSPMEGPIRMEVTAWLPVPRSWSDKKRRDAFDGRIAPTKRPDADNFGKIAADALNTVVFEDDCQICELIVRKRYSRTPGLRVVVEEI